MSRCILPFIFHPQQWCKRFQLLVWQQFSFFSVFRDLSPTFFSFHLLCFISIFWLCLQYLLLGWQWWIWPFSLGTYVLTLMYIKSQFYRFFIFRQCAASIYRNVCLFVRADEKTFVRTALYHLAALFCKLGFYWTSQAQAFFGCTMINRVKFEFFFNANNLIKSSSSFFKHQAWSLDNLLPILKKTSEWNKTLTNSL